MLCPAVKSPADVCPPPPQTPSLARLSLWTLMAGDQAGLGPAGVCSGFRGRSLSLRTAVTEGDTCSDGRRSLLAQVPCRAEASGPTPPPEPVTAPC